MRGMEAKIQANAFYPKNYHAIDLTGNTRNGLSPLCHDNQITRNGQDDDPLMTRVYQNGYSVYDIEKVRQTILKHESIFKNQLQELHRLHKRQRDLMNEIETEEKKKATNLTLARLGDVSVNSFSNSHLEPKDFFKDSFHGMDRGSPLCNFGSIRTGNEHLFGGHAVNFPDKRRMDEHSGTRDFCSAMLQMSSEALLAVPRNEVLSSPLELCDSLCPKKRKIFGVEIYEGNDDSCDAASNTLTRLRRNDFSNSESFWTKESITLKPKIIPHLENHRMVFNDPSSWNPNSFFKKLELVGKNLKDGCADVDPENPRGELPWFLRNTQYSGEPCKEMKNSYFVNLDSLQNRSQTFFTKDEIADVSLQSLKQKKEFSAPMFDEGGTITVSNNGNCANKILGFPIPNMSHSFMDLNNGNGLSYGGGIGEVKMDEKDPRNELETKNLDSTTNLRHHIDLNLSLEEEDAPIIPSLPKASVRITTTEIDLEADPFHEEEEEEEEKEEAVSPQKLEVSDEESDKVAIDALMYISCSHENSLSDDGCLKWFAEIISSQCDDSSDWNGTRKEEEDYVLEGMDYFEYMTLKLQDITDEHHLYNPMVVNIPSECDEGHQASKGSRRRGRHQKDFQRDILPGLVTLSRHEMKEDLKAFEEIRKGEGSRRCFSRSNSAKKGKKGKKHLVGPSSSALVKPVTQELSLVEGSLVGWGKRTRRLPRQRCANLVYLSLPVKC